MRDYNKIKGGGVDLPPCKLKFSRKGRMIKCRNTEFTQRPLSCSALSLRLQEVMIAAIFMLQGLNDFEF